VLTLEEANRLLPKVREFLVRLRGFRDEVLELEKKKAVEELAWLKEDGTVSPRAQEEIQRLVELQEKQAAEFEKALRELHATGAQLKELDEGLVDFPSRQGEDEILLCWKEGEPRIAYWHDLQSGFAGRQPLREFA